MARPTNSASKRDREFKKRERDRKKREKAELKRQRREGDNSAATTPAPGGVPGPEGLAQGSVGEAAASPPAEDGESDAEADSETEGRTGCRMADAQIMTVRHGSRKESPKRPHDAESPLTSGGRSWGGLGAIRKGSEGCLL